MAHVTFRPETQKMLLEYIMKNNQKYKLKEEDIGFSL